MGIKDPSNEKWYVEKYATTNNGIGWLDVGDLNDDEIKSLIFYLLNNIGDMAGDNTLCEIIENKPELMEFYRKDILSDIDMLGEIQSVTENFWNLSKGSTDEEVDTILSTMEEDADDLLYLKLLMGADTEYSLKKAAELSKDHPGYIMTAKDLNLLINEDGTYERRYSSERWDLFKVKDDSGKDVSEIDGIELISDPKTSVSGGKLHTCNNEAQIVLNADLSVIPPFAETELSNLKNYFFFSTNCECCDSWLMSNALKVKPGEPWDYIGKYRHDWEDGKVHEKVLEVNPEDVDCDPECLYPLEEDVPKLKFVPADLHCNGTDKIASLGGRPRWVQSEEIPTCPECGKMMFYVGQNQASVWADMGDQVVFGFVCEKCNVAIEVVQFT